MTPVYPYVRFPKVTQPDVPPTGFVDLVYDQSAGTLAIRERDGTLAEIGGAMTSAEIIAAMGPTAGAAVMAAVTEADLQAALPDVLELESFTLSDQTGAVLTAGKYAEDALGRICRHDGVTPSGNLITRQRYSGMRVVDYDGLGGSSAGSLVQLDELKALFAGDAVEGDVIEIFGRTTFQLDPDDLPNTTPPFQGWALFQTGGTPSFDFWDLSNSGSSDVFQDVRDWSLRITVATGAWVLETPANLAVQQVTAVASGAAVMKTGALTAVLGAPAPSASVNGVITIPLAFVLIDGGSPFTAGTARLTWDLEVIVTRA